VHWEKRELHSAELQAPTIGCDVVWHSPGEFGQVPAAAQAAAEEKPPQVGMTGGIIAVVKVQANSAAFGEPV